MHLNKQQYHKLSKICDELLLAKHTPKEVIAITYLHIIREHPELLKQYLYLFYKLTKIKQLKQTIVKQFRYFLISLLRSISAIFNAKFWQASAVIKNSDVLFVSHLINSNLINKSDDFYFGNLACELEKQGLSSIIAMINHTKKNLANNIFDNYNNKTSVRVVLQKTLSFVAEMRIYIAQHKARLWLKQYINNDEFNNRVQKTASLEALSSNTANALRIEMQIAALIKIIKPKYLIITYEGHAWERLVFAVAKNINANIHCIAYQHTGIFKHQHAIRRLLSSAYNPDVILTAGRISLAQLNESPNLATITKLCLGSVKYNKKLIINNKNNACLVVPEGLVSECLLLFELSLSCAKIMPKQKFIWRLHPSISFKKLKKYSKIFNNLPHNISLSTNTLELDIKQCNNVLYRGSTAIINAINAGLKPIYYQKYQNEMTIDPLYQFNEGKFIVSNSDELQIVFTQQNDSKTQQKLQNFAQDFYTPLNAQVLVDLITKQ